jgi:hypothetical protein
MIIFLLVRWGILVKVTRTYEKDIYPYGVTVSCCGSDSGGLQTGRRNCPTGWDTASNAAGNQRHGPKVRRYFQFNLGIYQAGQGFARLFPFYKRTCSVYVQPS